MKRHEQLRRDHTEKAERMGLARKPPPDQSMPNASRSRTRRKLPVIFLLLFIVAVIVGVIITREHQGDQPPVAENANVMGSGTGFFVSPDGIFLTAAHVVEGSSRIAVKTDDAFWPAHVLRIDHVNDVAVLRVAVERNVSWIPLGDSGMVRMGESVFKVGFPNIELQGIEPKLTRGEISSITGLQDDPRSFQVSVPVQPGNSGGPLVNLQGQVVGLVIARLDDRAAFAASGTLPQNVNYAIKSAYVRTLLDTIPNADAGSVQQAQATQTFDQLVETARSAVGLVLVAIEDLEP